jgi:hypothetical protein
MSIVLMQVSNFRQQDLEIIFDGAQIKPVVLLTLTSHVIEIRNLVVTMALQWRTVLLQWFYSDVTIRLQPP